MTSSNRAVHSELRSIVAYNAVKYILLIIYNQIALHTLFHLILIVFLVNWAKLKGMKTFHHIQILRNSQFQEAIRAAALLKKD